MKRSRRAGQKRGSRRSAIAFGRFTRGAQVCLALAAVLSAAVLLGFLEHLLWLGVVAREWSTLLACALGFVLAASLLARAWSSTLIAVLGLLLCVWPAVALLLPTRPVPAGGPLLKIAVVGAEGSAPDPATLKNLVRRERPDVLALLGAAPRSLRSISRSVELVAVRHAEQGPRASVLYAQRKLLRDQHKEPTARPRPLLLRVGACDVGISWIELPSVLEPAQAAERQAAMARLELLGRRAVVIGDFGGRPQAPDLSARLAALSLRDTRAGFGVLATAPGALGPFGRAVDHVLVHGWLGARERKTLPALGPGQHRVSLATLELTEPACRQP